MYIPSNYGQGGGIQGQDYNSEKNRGKMYQQQGNQINKQQQQQQQQQGQRYW